MNLQTALLVVAVLLPAPARAYTASDAGNDAGGSEPGDKKKELPKREIEKHQDELKNGKRFDAYQRAGGSKADELKKKIDACKTEDCFDSVGGELDSAKQADFLKAEPNAPAGAGASDASRDRFYQDGAAKMGRVGQAAPPRLACPAQGLGTPLSPRTLKESQPVADLKGGSGAEWGGPVEQKAGAGAPTSVGRESARAEVAKAQGELNAFRRTLGLDALKQDGRYGTDTSRAVKDAQRELGLEETGDFDSRTRSALAKRLSKGRAADAPAGVRSGAQVVRRGGMAVDTDGDLRNGDPALSRLARRDPDRQAATSLRYADGRSLDPTRVPYVVIPGGSRFARLGDLVRVNYNGRSVLAIVGDIGPRNKFGEGSMALARGLGMSPSGTSGGVGGGVTYTFLGRNVGRLSGESALMDLLDPSGGGSVAGR